jgi:hypothetical protein
MGDQMGVTAAVVAVASVAGTVYSADQASNARRKAGQDAFGQRHDVQVAEDKRKNAIDLEENRAFSKIQRQRQRALAANSSAPASQSMGAGPSLGGTSPVAGGAAPGATSQKTRLGQ